jgi:hypothetical protein
MGRAAGTSFGVMLGFFAFSVLMFILLIVGCSMIMAISAPHDQPTNSRSR